MTDAGAYRAFIVDVDGTLVDHTFAVSSAVGAALKGLRTRGVFVSLSTGKPVQSCIGYIHDLGLAGYHTFCAGAHVTDPTGAGDLYASKLNPSRIGQVVQQCRAAGITLELYTHASYFVEVENDYTDIQKGFMLFPPTRVASLDPIAEANDVIKGHLILGTEREKSEGAKIMESVADAFSFSLGHVSGRRDLDFHSILEKGITKLAALERVAASTEIPLEQMVTIGDSGGDVGILQAAGIGVAMGDAQDEIKAVADDVVGSVQDDGLCEAIARYFPARA